MSARLARAVFDSALDPSLKPLMVALALFADQDGGNVYPSIDRLVFMVGGSRRTVERGISRLRTLGVIIPITSTAGGRMRGGRGRPVHYQIDSSALPSRAAYKPRHTRRGITGENPDTSDGVYARAENPGTDAGVSSSTPTSETSTPTPAAETPTFETRYPDTGDGRSFSDLPVVPVQGTSAQSAHFTPQKKITYAEFREQLRQKNPELVRSAEIRQAQREQRDAEVRARRERLRAAAVGNT